MKTYDLNNISEYVFGDIRIRPLENGKIRIYTDKGNIIIKPKADNTIEVLSTINKSNKD